MLITKYNASGNDFILFHTFLKQDFSDIAKKLCNRHSGIGADGLIVLIPHNTLDFQWLFYNSDGSTASMCGNGSRATAHYAVNNFLSKEKLKFLTNAGEIGCEVDGSMVQTELTTPKILKDELFEYNLKWSLIDTGVPHLVTIVDNLDKFDKQICKNMRYKYDANVNYVQVITNNIIKVRTYERGVEDETLACVTGMAASFLYAQKKSLVDNDIKVYPKSGEELYLRYINNILYFKGNVTKIFETSIRV
jgi:diaminopimelate epimerase